MNDGTVVVCGVGGAYRFGLPESRWDDARTFVHGGERSVYELAFAAAAAGHDVELRGYVCRTVYDELAAVVGARPTVDLDMRRPTATDTVLVPEGWAEPGRYLGVVGSPARVVLLQLAPIGLFGWGFDTGEPLPLDQAVPGPTGNVGTDAQVGTAQALGFELWANSDALAADLTSRGFACTWIGSGSPGHVAPGSDHREIDVAVVGGNRWEARNSRVIDALDGSALVTKPGSNAEIMGQLSKARILVHLARVEGHSRLGIEARRVGTIPVMDRANPYLAGASEDDGLVLVDSEDDAIEQCRNLLSDTDRLTELSRAGVEFAARWSDWSSYVRRVGDALASRPDAVGPRPLADLDELVEEQRDIVRVDERAHADDRLAAAREQHDIALDTLVAAQEARVHELEAALATATAERDATRAELGATTAEIEAMRATISWRLRNAVVGLPGAAKVRNHLQGGP